MPLYGRLPTVRARHQPGCWCLGRPRRRRATGYSSTACRGTPRRTTRSCRGTSGSLATGSYYTNKTNYSTRPGQPPGLAAPYSFSARLRLLLAFARSATARRAPRLVPRRCSQLFRSPSAALCFRSPSAAPGIRQIRDTAQTPRLVPRRCSQLFRSPSAATSSVVTRGLSSISGTAGSEVWCGVQGGRVSIAV